MEKDDTELELEKVVFGDDIGFHEALKSHSQAIAAPSQPATVQSQQEEKHGIEEEGLEDIDDADVGALIESTIPYPVKLTVLSALLPRFEAICGGCSRPITRTTLGRRWLSNR